MRARFLGKRSQRGQAWAEFVVVALFVLVPMAIVVPLLGKYIDAKYKVEAAARYAAWERTVWHRSTPRNSPVTTEKSDAAVLNEGQLRVLGDREAGIHSRQSRSEGDFSLDPLLHSSHILEAAQRHPILRERDQARGGQIPRYIDSNTTEVRTPGIARHLDSVFSRIQRLPHLGQFDLNTRGAYRADVALELLPPHRFPEFTGSDWTLRRSVTLVTDSWNVGGPEHNIRRVQALVPMALFDRQGMRSFLRALAWVEPLEPVELLEFGKVDVEVVPEQYLD